MHPFYICIFLDLDQSSLNKRVDKGLKGLAQLVSLGMLDSAPDDSFNSPFIIPTVVKSAEVFVAIQEIS